MKALGNMRYLGKFIICYVISILLFASFYYLAWIKNTSSFIVENQLNEMTYDAGFTYLEKVVPYEIRDSEIPTSIADFNQQVKPYILKLQSSIFEIDRLKSQEVELILQKDSIHKILMDSYSQNVEDIIVQKTKNKKDSISILKETKKSLIDDIAIANIEVEIAYINLRLAQIESDIRTDALKNMTSYYTNSAFQKFEIANGKYLENLGFQTKHANEIRDLKSFILTLKDKFHSNRYKQLRYIDFVYFSFLTSTSTSFGDIIPNTSYMRLVISLQIFCSLLFLGFLINIITEKIINKKTSQKI